MNLLIILRISVLFFTPIEFYDIKFTGIDGSEVKMSGFKGKKVLVATIDAPNAAKAGLAYLDSLQNARTDLQVIVIPVINAFRNNGLSTVQEVQRNAKSRLIFSYPSDVKRDTEKYQHPLFQWLTKIENNRHFNRDGKPWQYFIISAKGTLYGIFEPDAPRWFLEKAVMDEFDESNEYIFNPETSYYEPRN